MTAPEHNGEKSASLPIVNSGLASDTDVDADADADADLDAVSMGSMLVDEFGELLDPESEDGGAIDPEVMDDEEDNEDDADEDEDETEEPYNCNESSTLADVQAIATTSRGNSWDRRSFLAPNETDKEYEMFRTYALYDGGATHQYVSQISGFSVSRVKRIAKENNWERRLADYQLKKYQSALKKANGNRHQEHLRKLEEYRQEQEVIGRQMTESTRLIMQMGLKKLNKMIESDHGLKSEDIISAMTLAVKLAETGKTIYGNALGVDRLLTALEETEE